MKQRNTFICMHNLCVMHNLIYREKNVITRNNQECNMYKSKKACEKLMTMKVERKAWANKVSITYN